MRDRTSSTAPTSSRDAEFLDHPAPLSAKDFAGPRIHLAGSVDYDMYARFREQLETQSTQALVVVELSTVGGDPEVARMIGEDVRFHSDLDSGRRFVFLGKTAVYSAGATLMSFFAPANRYLTRGTRLMIHERKLEKTLRLTGPLTASIAPVKALLHELEQSIEIQNEGFDNLIRGSKVSMGDLLRRAPGNWYIEAEEAKALGLVAGIV